MRYFFEVDNGVAVSGLFSEGAEGATVPSNWVQVDPNSEVEIGYLWEGGAWVNPTLQDIEALRKYRDKRLEEFDWMFLSDAAAVSDSYMAAVRVYRQELRDLPNTLAAGGRVVLPETPRDPNSSIAAETL